MVSSKNKQQIHVTAFDGTPPKQEDLQLDGDGNNSESAMKIDMGADQR